MQNRSEGISEAPGVVDAFPKGTKRTWIIVVNFTGSYWVSCLGMNDLFYWINSVWGLIESSCLDSNMWNGHSNANVLSVVVVIAKRLWFFGSQGYLDFI